MNATERDQLQQFLSALRQTRADPKDPTADGLIREAVSAQADAPYLLVQRAMGLGVALDAAQMRIAQLEAQCAQQLAQLAQLQTSQASQAPAPASNGSWMSGAQSWGREAQRPAQPLPTASAPFATTSPAAARTAAMPAQAPAATSAWGGGMMAQVATTAAGVVAGGLLFQGVQSLMGHHNPSPASNPANSPASPLSNAQDEALPGLVSPQASADDAGDASWDSGEDWA
ncbi:DUF2076 domain-containing protein [Limnohabitans planktonicus]|uniref:ABC transporter substrate-binding protein n=1 Tax=Limnohabitans planktonicus II-D5 TaxID=1293045 RepID=A0A2T7UF86_9BURK|nr:DUF2076 domain-containing protein [Limnohabitans planktonicus]PVE43304.1 hypothetical protein H663_006945 [Limnohabitans planktonicus II-D5]|eukprot:gene3409-3336_t